MFDLEKAIRQWRQHLRRAGIRSRSVMDELESHLRDDVEHQVRSGISAEQAFAAAAERIGRAGELEAEFSKAAGSVPTQSRWRLRAFCLGFAALVLGIDIWTLLAYEVSPAERLWGLAAVSLLAFTIGALPCWDQLIPEASRKPMATVMKSAWALAQLWVPVALLNALQILHWHIGITLQMLLWTLYAWAAATMIFGLFWRPDRLTPKQHGPPLTPDQLTPLARQSLEVAEQEAARLQHDFLGTEHLLLALLRLEQGPVPRILLSAGLAHGVVRAEIQKRVGTGALQDGPPIRPLTPRARKALELAAREAEALNCSRVGAEHVLLGLLLEGDGVAARVLKRLHVKADKLREAVARELDSGDNTGPQPVPAG